jgi:hypothetical protein
MASILKALEELDILPETDVHSMNKSKVGAALGTLEPEGKSDIMSALDKMEGMRDKPDADEAGKFLAPGRLVKAEMPTNIDEFVTSLKEGYAAIKADPIQVIETVEMGLFPYREEHDPTKTDLENAPAHMRNVLRGAAAIPFILPAFATGVSKRLIGEPVQKFAEEWGLDPVKIGMKLVTDRKAVTTSAAKTIEDVGTAAVEEAKGFIDIMKMAIPYVNRHQWREIFTHPEMVWFGAKIIQGSGRTGKKTLSKANNIRRDLAGKSFMEGRMEEAAKHVGDIARTEPDVIREASIALAEKFKEAKDEIETLTEKARTPEQRQAAIDKVMPTKLEDTLKLKAQARQTEIDKVMPKVTPEEAPKVLQVETSMGLIDKLVSDIKSKDKVQVPVAERKPGDVKLIEQDRNAVMAEIEKLEGLRDVAEKATGMNLKSLYDKAIDDAIATLPIGEKVELQSTISNFRKEVHFTDIESYKARRAKDTKEAKGKVDKQAKDLKPLVSDLYKGDESALPRLRKAVEDYGAEDVAQAVRSTYTEGDTPGYKKLRPEIDRVLELKAERRKQPEFRERIDKEIKEMEVAKAKGETLESQVEKLPGNRKSMIRSLGAKTDKTSKDTLDRYRDVFGKDVVDSVLKVKPKVKPKLAPKPKVEEEALLFVKERYPRLITLAKEIKFVDKMPKDAPSTYSYLDKNLNIIINTSKVTNTLDIVESIAHELRHALSIKKLGVEEYNKIGKEVEKLNVDIESKAYEGLPLEKEAFRAGDLARARFLRKQVKPDMPKAKPKVEPEPKPKEPLNETERLMAELDGLAPKHLVRRAKELGLEQTVWSKAYSNPEFVKRQIVSKELKPAKAKVEPTPKGELTPELKAEARTVFTEIIKKPELTKEDVKWLKDNKDALDLNKEETQAIKTKMASALVEPGFFMSETQYKASLGKIKAYFKGEKPYGEKLFGAPGLDPQLLRDTARVIRYHIEQGTKDFYQVSQKMLKDVGVKVRPYLKSAWGMAQEQIKNIPTSKKDLAIANETLKRMGIEAEVPVKLVSEAEASGLSPTAVNEPGLIGRFLNLLESTNQTLESYRGPYQEQLNAVQRIMVEESYIPKQMWVVERFKQFDNVMGGVRRSIKADKIGRIGRESNKLGRELSEVLELEDMAEAKGVYSDRSIEIAKDVRKVLDSIYNELEAAGVKDKKGRPILWRKGYLPHMVKESNMSGDLKRYIEDALEGKHDDVIGSISGSVDLYGTRKPLPTFGHAERRTGAMKDYERNPLIALRRYVLGASRILYDRPGIERASAEIGKVPKGFMKDLATKYLSNYMRISDSVSGTLRLVDAKIGRMGARSVLAFSTGLQTLHLGRTATQIWPELGTRYSLAGLNQLLVNPRRAITETVNAGLIPQAIVPYKFKFRGEVFDKISNYGDVGNTIAKTIAYQGFLRKIYAEHPNWTSKQIQTEAIKQTIKAEGMIVQATKSVAMEKVPKFFLQFKYWFQKYGENASRAVAAAAKDPSMANVTRVGRYIAAAVITEEITRQTGLKIFHITPYLLQLSAPIQGYILDMMRVFLTANVTLAERLLRAFKRTSEFVIPGGISVPREVKEKGTFLHKKD